MRIYEQHSSFLYFQEYSISGTGKAHPLRYTSMLHLLVLPVCMGSFEITMIRFQIFLPQQLLDRLRSLSDSTGYSVAEHIRRAVEAYLKKVEKQQ